MQEHAEAEFIHAHLGKVSRSFALAIRVLDQPLRHWVGLSYLMFRVLDTIEDAKWTTYTAQKRAFDMFENQLTSPSPTQNLKVLFDKESQPDSVSSGEVALLSDFDRLLEMMGRLPADVKTDITASLLQMSRGMRYFTLREWGHFRLQNLDEVDLYCYFVAGLVGELLTRLLYHARESAIKDASIMHLGVEFGLFLQKVNILKDQLEDESIGRHLVPDRAQIRKSLLKHADASMDYILKIHPESKPYALFCALSLFLGMISIPYIESSFSLKKLVKPSREATLHLLTHLQDLVATPEAMLEYYRKLRVQLA